MSYFYKTLWKISESRFLNSKTSAMIMWLFIGSWTFASVFSYLGGHEVFEQFLNQWIYSRGNLVITQIIIFLLGWPPE